MLQVALTQTGMAIGTCYCVPYPPGPYPATGIIMTGAPESFDSGMQVAYTTSSVIFPCGSSVVITGSANFFKNGLMVARTSDSVTGCGVGTIVGSAPQHLTT